MGKESRRGMWRQRGVLAATIAGLLVQPGAAWAQFQIPDLSQLPGLNLPESIKNLPGGLKDLPNLFPKDEQGEGSGLLTGGVCALVGAGAAVLAKKYAVADAKRNRLSKQEQKRREQSYMIGWGLFGCALGGGIASKIMENLSESARKAQEEAWQQAQGQTGPVVWRDPNDPNTHGTTEIIERKPEKGGGECGTRRDVIETAEGSAEPMVRVCRVAGSNVWQPDTGVV